MPQPLDAAAVRRWCRIALDTLGRDRAEIDAINVFPVPDADTGTNLYLTMESADRALTAAAQEPGTGTPGPGDAARTMAHGALIGARGNSGTILAQLLRGMAQELAAAPADDTGPEPLRRALRRAATSAYEAVSHPVEGTMLTVAAAAADAADRAPARHPADIAAAACAGARTALAATPGQLDALARAQVVDAGGSGLVTVLDALDAALSGRAPDTLPHHGLGRPAGHRRGTPGDPAAGHPGHEGCAGGGYEVIYLLDARDDAVPALRRTLDALGDSLVIVGGDGLWNVHVHTSRPGPAVEAGIEAGRPHRISITQLTAAAPGTAAPAADRAVVCVMPGDGLAALCAEAGATALTADPARPPATDDLAAAIDRAGSREIVLLPNDGALWHASAAAAEQARQRGVRVAVIPTRSPVQGLAALAVHAAERRFDEDVVAMTSAAGATRFGEVTVAERESWTTVGICQAGDVLGLIDGDVAVIGSATEDVAADLLTRMLSAGGELVTLVLGDDTPAALADRLERQVRRGHLGVDTVVYRGRQAAPLLIGVE
ncbi:DAK2 domain-containing protein [Streptomyces carpaticus]|uniref:DAK2 domain-containing protein n=1 Tax=Streptomyces carpaticus TaxID=285558 RepID=UPI0031FA0135